LKGGQAATCKGRGVLCIGQPDIGVTTGKFSRRFADTITGGIGGRQRQNGEAFADNGHRAVAYLGRGKGSGVQGAGFLELKGGFLSDAKAVAASDDEQVGGGLKGRQGRAPVSIKSGFQLRGQGLQAVFQALVAAPFGDNGGIGGQRHNIGFGGS